MTDPKTVSDAEVEAGAKIIRDVNYDMSAAEARVIAHDVLTAAAQVRERADDDNRIATPAQEADLAGYVESVARALHEAHMPYCDYTYPFDDPMSSADMYRALACAVTRVSPVNRSRPPGDDAVHALGRAHRKLTSATEPDQGEDMLGIPRGEV